MILKEVSVLKEASGEFSMTVVVIVAAIIIVGILALLLPSMSNFIQDKWQDMVNSAILFSSNFRMIR